MLSFFFFSFFSVLNNHKIILIKPAEENELDKWSKFSKNSFEMQQGCYYTVLLLTTSIFSLYCTAEFRLHIFPVEPGTAPLPFNSSLYDSILPASMFIIETSFP